MKTDGGSEDSVAESQPQQTDDAAFTLTLDLKDRTSPLNVDETQALWVMLKRLHAHENHTSPHAFSYQMHGVRVSCVKSKAGGAPMRLVHVPALRGDSDRTTRRAKARALVAIGMQSDEKLSAKAICESVFGKKKQESVTENDLEQIKKQLQLSGYKLRILVRLTRSFNISFHQTFSELERNKIARRLACKITKGLVTQEDGGVHVVYCYRVENANDVLASKRKRAQYCYRVVYCGAPAKKAKQTQACTVTYSHVYITYNINRPMRSSS